MTFQEILTPFLWNGALIHRTSKPDDNYENDGAEGGKYGIWKYDSDEDELIPNWKFGIEDLAATDWEVISSHVEKT